MEFATLQKPTRGQPRFAPKPRHLDCARKVIGWSSPEMVAKSYFLGDASPLSVVLAQHTGATGAELQRLAHLDQRRGLCERIEGARR